MDARLQDLPFDPAALHGLSPGLIASHHQNNYGGAVKRLNAICAQLASTAFASAPGFQLNGFKREELIATNSMLLHELYFGSLAGDGVTMEPAFYHDDCAAEVMEHLRGMQAVLVWRNPIEDGRRWPHDRPGLPAAPVRRHGARLPGRGPRDRLRPAGRERAAPR
jgi:hypothetical protein